MSVNNILAIYYQSTSQEIAEGRIWYDKALEFINDLSTRYDVDRTLVAVVISCLSPRNKWERNLIDAENLIKDYYYHGYEYCIENTVTATYNANKRRALDFLEGNSNLDTFFTLDKQSGLKTACFAANLLGNHKLVTIDVWAIGIFLGYRVTKENNYNLTPKRYRMISEAYVKAAEIVGNVTACQLQACTWLTAHRILQNKEN